MFKDLIESLKEAFGASSPADFDTSDSPAEPAPKKVKGPPKSIPLKAMRNVQKPISNPKLPGVDRFAAAKAALGKPRTEAKVFESLIAEAKSLLEGGGSRASKAARQNKHYQAADPQGMLRRRHDPAMAKHGARQGIQMRNSDELADKTKEVKLFGRKMKLGPARGTVKIDGKIQKSGVSPDKARDAVNDLHRNAGKKGLGPTNGGQD